MPELPEVETICRDLRRLLLSKNILRVEILDDRVLQGFDPSGRPRRKVNIPEFVSQVSGRTIDGIQRRGKYLLFTLSRPGQIGPPLNPLLPKEGNGVVEQELDSTFLVCHLRMTGQLILGSSSDTARARFYFAGSNDVLNFCDTRRFGELWLTSEGQDDPVFRALGPEPLTNGWDGAAWGKELRSSRAKVQAALLDQKRLAGVGNIYATEALFWSGIRPTRRCHTLRQEDTQRILKSVRRVLEAGLRFRGVSFSSYRDATGRKGDAQRHLAVYGRSGKPCKQCHELLKEVKVSGRGTAYCPQCQK